MSAHATPHRILGTNVIATLGEALQRYIPHSRLLLVGDDETLAAASAQALAALSPATTATTHSLGKRVSASRNTALALAEIAKDYDALLAIGSGTVNDLCKYAAAQSGKPYAVVATAASMNGYCAANASLEDGGCKQSFEARPPIFVLADTTILSAAPKRLTRAGIGDTLCRTTVEADMLLSHWIMGTPYPSATFDIFRQHEAMLLGGLMSKRDNEPEFVATLMLALLDAGDAMTTHGSSAVASQGEHMIAHTLELKYGEELKHLLHGELIAITSLTMSQLQQRMLLTDPRVKPIPYSTEQFQRLMGMKHASHLAALYAKKMLTAEQTLEVNITLSKHWPEISVALSDIMLSTNTLERALIHSGITTKPAQLGLAEERYRFAVSYAHLTRDRFTFLDLAVMNTKRVV